MRYEYMKALEKAAKKMSIKELKEKIRIYREKINSIYLCLSIAPPDCSIVNPGYSLTREAALENELKWKEGRDKIFELQDETAIFAAVLKEKEAI